MKIDNEKMEDFFDRRLWEDYMVIREDWSVAFPDGDINHEEVAKTIERCSSLVKKYGEWVRDNKWQNAKIAFDEFRLQDYRGPYNNAVVVRGGAKYILHNPELSHELHVRTISNKEKSSSEM